MTNRKTPMTDLYQSIIDTLSSCRRVLVTTHVRPDGDALGSAAALVLGMRQKGIEAEVLLLSHLPRKYAFIFQENQIVHHDMEKGGLEQFPFGRYDALVVADTGTWSQLPGLKEPVEKYRGHVLILDHHRTQEAWGQLRLVETQAAAASEIVFKLLEKWQVRLDHGLANALYLAIVSDTGWFQFSNTSPATLRMAATLMECGIDSDRMYQALYQNERKERLALQTRALDALELHKDGRLAVMCLREKDFKDTGAGVPDTENLINVPLQVATVEVSMLIVEPPELTPTRISLRSKGQVDVARFAERFGGGGHARASGLKLPKPLQEAHDIVVGAMIQELEASACAAAPPVD